MAIDIDIGKTHRYNSWLIPPKTSRRVDEPALLKRYTAHVLTPCQRSQTDICKEKTEIFFLYNCRFFFPAMGIMIRPAFSSRHMGYLASLLRPSTSPPYAHCSFSKKVGNAHSPPQGGRPPPPCLLRLSQFRRSPHLPNPLLRRYRCGWCGMLGTVGDGGVLGFVVLLLRLVRRRHPLLLLSRRPPPVFMRVGWVLFFVVVAELVWEKKRVYAPPTRMLFRGTWTGGGARVSLDQGLADGVGGRHTELDKVPDGAHDCGGGGGCG